jgi:cytochrome P450
MTLRTLPFALARRHAPPFLKHRLRDVRTWAREFRKRQRISGPVFVCGGRMEFWPEHGQELYAREPAFRSAVQECDHLLRNAGEEPVLGYFAGSPGAEDSRPAHLSLVMQISTLELWRARGVQPEALLGLGLGEVAAVYAAGGLTLEDALAVGTSWSRIEHLETAGWRMLEVTVEPARVAELVDGSPAELSHVGVTGPRRCTFLCALGATPIVSEYLTQARLEWREIEAPPQRPYHSIRLARHEETLRQPLESLRAEPLATPCYLGSLGRLAPRGTVLGPDYWLATLQHPVLVHHTFEAARRDGCSFLVPTGCEPAYLAGNPLAKRGRARGLPSLAPKRDGPASETIAAVERVLAAGGLVHREPAVRPLLTLPQFLAEFTPQACTFVDHPAATFEYLRRAGGMHYLPREEGWLVLEAKLINAALGAPQVYSSSPNSFSPELMGADPPAHTEVRALFQPFFAPQKIRELGEYAASTIDKLAAKLSARPSFDFVTDFALELTRTVNERLIGLSEADSAELNSRLPRPLYAFGYGEELQRYFEEFFACYQPSSQGLMLDRMAHLAQTGKFAPQSAVSLAKFMWEAGVLTTSMFITRAVHYLLHHPDRAEQLRSRPELIDVFIEELLRLEPPLNIFPRVTTRDVTLGDRDLPAGTKLLCCITAANRDPDRYARPDGMDLDRSAQRHLSFAGGVHACLGAHLARMETRMVLRWLLTGGRALRLADPFVMPQYFYAFNLRALATLPVRFQPAAAA